MKNWYVYIAECGDGTYYCGITTDVVRRFAQHNKGIGAKYTRGRAPIRCRVCVRVGLKSRALKLEYACKGQPKNKKMEYLLNSGYEIIIDDRID